MVSLLEGTLKARIAAGFKGKLTTGTLRRDTAGAVDSAGDATTPTVTTYTINGIRDSFSASYLAQTGIPITDVRILVLLGSVVPATTPVEDDAIYLNAPWNRWHQVRRVLEIDPAGASCLLQAFEIPAP